MSRPRRPPERCPWAEPGPSLSRLRRAAAPAGRAQRKLRRERRLPGPFLANHRSFPMVYQVLMSDLIMRPVRKFPSTAGRRDRTKGVHSLQNSSVFEELSPNMVQTAPVGLV